MISLVIVLVAIIANASFKVNTTFGWFQRTILGLLCVVPFLLGLIVDALQFGVKLLYKLAFTLGGTNSQELIISTLTKKGLPVKVVYDGDGSKDKDPDDKLQ
jgi:hypothetical protein